jgi:Rrf2 family protein
MHISKKSEYALKALVNISQHQGGKPVQITELSESEHIPVKFLEQILLALRKADILVSKRGVGGGYFLHRPSNQITVGEVIRLMDGPILPVPEDAEAGTPISVFMKKLQSEVTDLVDHTTIDDVIAMGHGKDAMFFDI